MVGNFEEAVYTNGVQEEVTSRGSSQQSQYHNGERRIALNMCQNGYLAKTNNIFYVGFVELQAANKTVHRKSSPAIMCLKSSHQSTLMDP